MSKLVAEGLLVRVGRGRSSRYELAPEAEPERADTTADAPRAPHRRRLVLAALVGVAALAVFGAAARNLPLVATHGFGLTTVFGLTTQTAAGPSVKPRSGDRTVNDRAPHASATAAAAPAKIAARHAGAGAAKHERVTAPVTRSTPPPVRQRAAQQPTYVSHVVTTPSHTAPASSGTSAAATPQASGPAPLRAPATSPPQPLRAP